MQWLIDLVIEAIGIPPVYIDRGDPAVSDWQRPFLEEIDTWIELDVSGIVPAEASAILFASKINANEVVATFEMRKMGNVNDAANSTNANSVVMLPSYEDLVVATSDSGSIEYKASFAIVTMDLTVKGWWL